MKLRWVCLISQKVQGSKGLKEAGGSRPEDARIEFYVVSDRGEPQLPDAFCRIKKILFLAKVIAF